MDKTKEFLLNILNTIGFEGNREEFTTNFLNNIKLQTVTDLVETLPKDKQDEAIKQLVDPAQPAEKKRLSLNNTSQKNKSKKPLKPPQQALLQNFLKA